jgi:hypothetical protein
MGSDPPGYMACFPRLLLSLSAEHADPVALQPLYKRREMLGLLEIERWEKCVSQFWEVAFRDVA